MMNGENPTTISLTGEQSHSIKIPPGQGSFAIGAKGMDAKKYDILVDDELPLNWDAFNTFFTPSGKQQQDRYPFGDWPRNFYYWGNDARFIEWSEKRKIEGFTWSPLKSITADFTNSKIDRLTINANEHPLELKLGNHRNLSLSGNLANITVRATGELDSLSFYPVTDKKKDSSYELPIFEAFEEVTSLEITVAPIGQPFNCESLLPFKKLKSISLLGNLSNLNCLKSFADLERLAIRYAPNLENLPSLNSWEKLCSFIAWNVEETKGKLLRSELKTLAKERELDYSSVSQLRKTIWFTTEYGIPFSAWDGKNAKVAIKSYKSTLKNLKKAKSEKEAKEILIDFIRVFNDLPNIETAEREDIGEAVDQLRQIPSFEIDEKKAAKWYDATRDY